MQTGNTRNPYATLWNSRILRVPAGKKTKKLNRDAMAHRAEPLQNLANPYKSVPMLANSCKTMQTLAKPCKSLQILAKEAAKEAKEAAKEVEEVVKEAKEAVKEAKEAPPCSVSAFRGVQ